MDSEEDKSDYLTSKAFKHEFIIIAQKYRVQDIERLCKLINHDKIIEGFPRDARYYNIMSWFWSAISVIPDDYLDDAMVKAVAHFVFNDGDFIIYDQPCEDINKVYILIAAINNKLGAYKSFKGIQYTRKYVLKCKENEPFETPIIKTSASFDQLRSISVQSSIHNWSCPLRCEVSINNWSKTLYLNDLQTNFAENLIPNHKEFAPVKCKFFPQAQEQQLEIHITGIIYHESMKDAFVETIKRSGKDYYSFGFTQKCLI